MSSVTVKAWGSATITRDEFTTSRLMDDEGAIRYARSSIISTIMGQIRGELEHMITYTNTEDHRMQTIIVRGEINISVERGDSP